MKANNYNSKKTNILYVIQIIILFKMFSSQLFNNFNSGQFSDSGELLDITNYNNLSLFVSISQNIYYGSPPSLISKPNLQITNLNSIATCNENFVLITCLPRQVLSKMNIKTEEITVLYDLIADTSLKNCPISILDDKVNVVFAQNYEGEISPILLTFKIANKNDTINGPIKGSNNVEMDFSYTFLPTSYERQYACESISTLEGNDFHYICFYVVPITNNDQTKYYIVGIVELKQYIIFTTLIETDIKVYKLDNYSLKCSIIDKNIDVKVEKIGNITYINKITDNYLTNNQFYSFHNDLVFSAYDNKKKLILLIIFILKQIKN